eukprot:12057300-Karenia_brevis.AAC.1
MAVLRVLQLDRRPLEIRSDSAYVIDSIKKRLASWRASGWTTKRGKRLIANADLWRAVDAQLRDRPEEHVLFTKIKGHASAQDVLSGQAQLLDKWGNDNADSLAVAGAFKNSGSEEARRQYRK